MEDLQVIMIVMAMFTALVFWRKKIRKKKDPAKKGKKQVRSGKRIPLVARDVREDNALEGEDPFDDDEE